MIANNPFLALYITAFCLMIVFGLLPENWVEIGGAGIHSGTRYSPTWQTLTFAGITVALMSLQQLADHIDQLSKRGQGI